MLSMENFYTRRSDCDGWAGVYSVGWGVVGGPGCGKAVDGFGEVVGAGSEVQADVVVASAGDVEGGAGEDGEAVAEGGLGERGAVAVGEAGPQALASGDGGDFPAGQRPGEQAVQVIVASLQGAVQTGPVQQR